MAAFRLLPLASGWTRRSDSKGRRGTRSAFVRGRRLPRERLLSAIGDPLHRAAEHLGRLLRTLFLCDYLAIDDFRREIHTLLNRGESVHQLQRAIYTGKVAPERGRRRDEMSRSPALMRCSRTSCWPGTRAA